MPLDAMPPLSRLLTFGTELEREFEAEVGDARRTHFRQCGFLGLGLYDLFLFYHLQLTPDVFGLACTLSLGVFSPMLLFTIIVPTRSRSVAIRETSWTVMPILAVVFFMMIPLFSDNPHRALSFFDAVLVMIFTTAVQRLRLRYTLAANLGMLVVALVGVSASDAFTPQTRAAYFVFFGVAGVLMFMAAYAFERESRLAYLAQRRTRLLNAELQRVTEIDPLTGLWNRRHLQVVMASIYASAPPGTAMAVLLIDVDHFKRFNDTFGHTAGDACLIAIGRCLDRCTPDGAVAVRYGGEEFLLFVPDCHADSAAALAELICAAVRGCEIPLETGGSVNVTCSVGVASAPPATIASVLIRQADEALYKAKALGRDRVNPDREGRSLVRAA